MTKSQKIWLWVLVGMFVIPEVLFGSVVKLLRLQGLPLYTSPQIFSDQPMVALLIVIIELIGVLGLVMLIRKMEIRRGLKFIFSLILGITLVLLFLSLYFTYVLSKISS